MQDDKIIIRIDNKTKKKFENLCQKSGRKMSSLIKIWIKEFIKKKKD